VGAVEAVVRITTGFAWPLLVAFGIWIFRAPIAKLIDRIKHLKAPGVEAEFSEEASATNQISAEIVTETPPVIELRGDTAAPEEFRSLSEEPSLDDLLEEADRHPVGAIVRAWNLIEYLVARTGAPVGTPPSAALRTLGLAELVSGDVVALGQRLGRLRNEVVHGSVIPDRDSARDFVEATWRLATVLEKTAPFVYPPRSDAPFAGRQRRFSPPPG
jgi:hypothetical protein